MLALIMLMYASATSHWAMNLSMLSTKLRGSYSIECSPEACSPEAEAFALDLLLGINVSCIIQNATVVEVNAICHRYS
jgi:hypothetical protein